MIARKAVQLVNTRVTVSGSLTYHAKDKIGRQKLSVDGHLQYLERIDEVPEKSLVFRNPSDKARIVTTRHYQRHDVKVRAGNNEAAPRLARNHLLLGTITSRQAGFSLHCKGDFLSRSELDLVDVQFPHILLHELLPAGAITKSSKWQPTENVLAQLLRIDAISKTTVEASLANITAKKASIRLAGTIAGAVRGVSTDIDLTGTLEFDRIAKSISTARFSITEKRAIGHAEPGLDVKAEISLTARPSQASQEMLSFTAPAAGMGAEQPLRFSASSGIRVLHDRHWQTMLNRVDLAVLRMVKRGDLVAQCNITPLPKLLPDQDISMGEFQRNIRANLDKALSKMEEATETTTKSGLRILRVVASGAVAEVPIRWVYCLVSRPDGRRASLVFTLESKLVEQFAEADRIFVSGIDFVAPAIPKTARKTPEKKDR